MSGLGTFDGLNPPYGTVVVDPPWRMDGIGATKANASRYYSTMSLGDICKLPVRALTDESAHLWLWAVNGLLEEAFVTVRAWGFRPTTVLTWCKPGPGVGHYLRNNTEHCIFATRGKPVVPEDKPMASWYVWDRGPHSTKPAPFYDLVEQVSPEPRVELFCRTPRFGWDTWGAGFESERAS